MLPIANPAQSRAGPVTVQPARLSEMVADITAAGQVEIPPVEQAEAASGTFQRGRDDLDRALAAQSAAALRLRSQRAKTATIDADSPQDRAVFRAKVIKFLQAIYRDDASFQRALDRGTIVVRAVEDMPPPDLRPEIAHAIYRHGAAQTGPAPVEASGPRAVPQSVGAGDFVAWWPK
ncbi:hypothetical protein SAMN04487972_10993 [Paracoccus halophilus]|uniref:Uncharacterized protein n=1 Tax=Paracoccus halophilus TaxID=376733 RepID=A0A099EW30_9RHOB|nr:hypothetical protein [Paracoccus halophilus]KGJ02585.1 hypothetical protein IT41_17050 [Paracoccus halophilus]SFA52310.1 hypothetical protein SAMN04487972_10993 [Paracoccus halophilus]